MNIQQEELNYQKEPTILLFGNELDANSLYIFSFGIILSIFIWFYFGFFTGHNKYFLIFLCLLFLYQITEAGTSAASYSIEDNEIKEVNQSNSILFSSVIILIAFGNKSLSNEHYKMLIISSLLSLAVIIYISVKKSSGSKRFIRKVKIAFMTISIFMFAMMLFNLGCSQFGMFKGGVGKIETSTLGVPLLK